MTGCPGADCFSLRIISADQKTLSGCCNSLHVLSEVLLYLLPELYSLQELFLNISLSSVYNFIHILPIFIFYGLIVIDTLRVLLFLV